MSNVDIISRVFPRAFEVNTLLGIFSAKRVPEFPTEEIHVFDPAGNQVARLGLESNLSSVYNIIVTGGGFYQFGRDRNSGRNWICKGVGRLLCLTERSWRKFIISDGADQIAEFSKHLLTNDYAAKIFNDADLKLVICIVLALNESEYVGPFNQT